VNNKIKATWTPLKKLGMNPYSREGLAGPVSMVAGIIPLTLALTFC
jgi:hypothetical protein